MRERGAYVDARTNNEMGAYPRDALLGRLPEATVEALATRWIADIVPQGRLIIGEGDQDRDLFFVLDGVARAAVFTLNGKEVAFREIGLGDCFGELAAIDKGPRAASVVARTAATVARLTARDFDQLITEEPAFAAELLQLLAGKLRELSSRVVEYAELTGAQRVRRELLRLARLNRTGLDQALIADLPTQSELATMILVRRELVAREMADLGRRGAISRRDGGLYVASVRSLEAIAATE